MFKCTEKYAKLITFWTE